MTLSDLLTSVSDRLPKRSNCKFDKIYRRTNKKELSEEKTNKAARAFTGILIIEPDCRIESRIIFERRLITCYLEVNMCASSSRWLGDWRHLVEKPTSAEDVEQAVERGSIPAFAFYFMLVMSAVIAAFGLLANSVAVIIGAMIVAPLMNPFVAMSYGLVAGRGQLITRSLLVVLTGTILTITVSIIGAGCWQC